jgi:hypothetical protein
MEQIMTIEPATNQAILFTDQMISFGSTAFEACMNGITWLGHTVEYGFTSYAIPAAAGLKDFAAQFFVSFQNTVQSYPVPLAITISCFFLISLLAFKNKALTNDIATQKVYQLLGTVALVNVVAFTTLGVAAVLI